MELDRSFTGRSPIHPQGESGSYQLHFTDKADLSRHVDYIHINPVKHGLVPQVAAWPHSSFHRYVQPGILPKDWAGDAGVELAGGEREGVIG